MALLVHGMSARVLLKFMDIHMLLFVMKMKTLLLPIFYQVKMYGLVVIKPAKMLSLEEIGLGWMELRGVFSQAGILTNQAKKTMFKITSK